MTAKLSLTAAESALVDQIFKRNDPQNFGVITGDVAVSVFSGSSLPSTTLGEIWALSDSDNKGFLDKNGVGVAVRLIGHAQAGKTVNNSLLGQPSPPASISNYSQLPTSQGARSPAPKPPVDAGLPPLTPADKAKFLRLFQSCGPVKGLLPGDKARDVFVKSKLPVDKLSQIWTLADTKGRGALDATDFTIAMYMVQALMGGSLSFVPTTLPPGLYEQASSGDVSRPPAVAVHATGGSASSYSPGVTGAFPGRAVQPQYTGQAIQPQVTGGAARPPAPAIPSRGQSSFIPPFPAQASQAPWDVSPAEKANSDKFFETLDSQKKGYIEGDVAVPFLLQSKLSEDVLAQVWDLADLNNDGRLTRDGFAVAMHLIQGKLAGNDIPSTLPTTLVPPSMRSTIAPPPQQQQPLAPVHELSDLLFDDAPFEPAKPVQPALQPQSTGAFSAPLQPQSTGAFSSAPLQPQRTAGSAFGSPPVQPQTTGPFQSNVLQPQSTGAYGTKSPPLNPQTTGSYSTQAPAFSSAFSVPQSPPKDPFGAPAGSNLLDDDEPAGASPPIQNHSAEIGNTQNQLHSTNRSLEITKSEREDVEARIAEQAAQLSALQTQLTAAKASYETETRLLAQLRERFSNQSAEISTARHELIRAESDLSAARVEKAEVEQGVLHDKEEIRDLQRKMAETGAAIEGTKAEIERARKEAKQQKGLLAIAKKQLATREAERAKVDKELQEAKEEAAAAAHEREEAEAEIAKEPIVPVPAPAPMENGHPKRVASPGTDSLLFAAAQPLPGTPSSVGSPGQKSNNPFDRLVGAQHTGGSLRSQSPFMPFANASLPSSPPPAEHVLPAPMAFEKMFSPNGEAGAAPEPSVPGEFPGATEVASPTSDTNDLFSTPPTRPADGHGRFGTAELDLAATQFPPLDTDGDSSVPAPAPAPSTSEDDTHKPETDIGVKLTELEPDELDSSDEEDNMPLSEVAAAKALEHAVVAHEAPTTDVPAAPVISFDDAFGDSALAPAPVASSPFDLSKPSGSSPLDTQRTQDSSPFDQAFGAPTDAHAPVGSASSKIAFDEALGKAPAPAADAGGAGPSFSFDDAFEDSFDFNSSSAAAAAPVTVPAPATTATAPSASMGFFPPPPNGTARHSMLPPPSSSKTSPAFDSAFTSPPAPAPIAAPERTDSNPFALSNAPAAWAPTTSAPQPDAMPVPPTVITAPNSAAEVAPSADAPPATTASGLGISFDDAFGGQGSQALALDSAFNSVSSRASAATSQASAQANANATPFPATASPTRVTFNGGRNSLSSPPRESTPPPARMSSPRPRPSTASSSSRDDRHDKADKGKEPRHSKLSIRLPFGKKKKTQDNAVPAAASSNLLPVPDEDVSLPTNATPAVDDDIEVVKQLCGMGFSRTQAVSALEANAYDFQRALNSLLGTP